MPEPTTPETADDASRQKGNSPRLEPEVTSAEANMTVADTEKALRETQERYRLIVEGVKEYAMFTMDEAGRIDSWNEGARRILGYDEGEIIGKPGAIIFTPEDRQAGAVEKELERARTQGQAINERWHVRQDGSYFWGSGVVTSLWDDGWLRGYAKVMRDNTLRKQADEQLRQSQERLQALNETLEERVRQRTEQLRELASELVISEQKVRHRISQVLHDDLQQLLYALEMQLQFFRDDFDPASSPEASYNLDQMAEMIRSSIRLTRQLTVEISPPVLQGEGLLQALKWLASHMREIYGLEVAIEASDHPDVANQDERILLFQIVREILFNVVKHAGVKEARLTLHEEADGLTIEVVDRGRGFDAERELATLDKGFGLHNVRERLQLFNGRLDIDSKPGAGVRASVFMPGRPPGAEQ